MGRGVGGGCGVWVGWVHAGPGAWAGAGVGAGEGAGAAGGRQITLLTGVACSYLPSPQSCAAAAAAAAARAYAIAGLVWLANGGRRPRSTRADQRRRRGRTRRLRPPVGRHDMVWLRAFAPPEARVGRLGACGGARRDDERRPLEAIPVGHRMARIPVGHRMARITRRCIMALVRSRR